MNMRKIWLLMFAMLSFGEMCYSGPLAKTVGTSVGVSTWTVVSGFIGRALDQLSGQPVDAVQDIGIAAGVTGIIAGVVSAPVFSSLHGADIRHNIENSKDHYFALHHEKVRSAWRDIIDRRKSPFEKKESRKELMASQLALYKIAEYNKTSSTTCIHNALDCTPVILTVCGLFPAILCDGGTETMAAILAASYCSGGAALLHAKIQEKKWNSIEEQVKKFYIYGISKNAVNIPDNFMCALNLQIDETQRCAEKECSQMNLGERKDAIFDLMKRVMNQSLQLDGVALSQADRESRITQKFGVGFDRNEDNTERKMTIFKGIK